MFRESRDLLSQRGSAYFDSDGPGTYHARAMANPLRDRRTAAEWAASRQVIDFKEKLSGFRQLSAIVEADLAALDAGKTPPDWRDAVISGRLAFDFADARQTLPIADVAVATTLDAVCQRCLEAFRLPVEAEARLLLLEFEQTVDGYDDHEVWELEESTLRPQDIVEELLILALPFAATHKESKACRALSAEAPDSEETNKPFAALREQMTHEK